MRISDWSSDVCSSDLPVDEGLAFLHLYMRVLLRVHEDDAVLVEQPFVALDEDFQVLPVLEVEPGAPIGEGVGVHACRSEEHTSELQSLMRISYAVFCLKKKTS